MDQIDINLLDAWHRIGVQCQRDPRKALVRMRRRLKKTVFQPPRAWCLSIRAADTRINRYRAVIDPPYADERLLEHDVALDGSLIRFLTRPPHASSGRPNSSSTYGRSSGWQAT